MRRLLVTVRSRTTYVMPNRSHGFSATPTYHAWRNMIDRCEKRSTINFQDYGGRGIKVCSRWRESFAAFLEDMGPKPSPGRTSSLDRIDNDGNYEPGNVRWATRIEQARNKRNNRLITINGITRCAAEWCEVSGVPWSMAKSRLRRGWSEERTFSEPPKIKGERNSMAKLTDDAVREIRSLYGDGGVSHRELGEKFGVCGSVIGQVVNRSRWKHVD